MEPALELRLKKEELTSVEFDNIAEQSAKRRSSWLRATRKAKMFHAETNKTYESVGIYSREQGKICTKVVSGAGRSQSLNKA